jgi:formylglycine-generating enzyme required for sulfatase activity
MSLSTADLRQFLTDYFSDDEFTTLCFDFFTEVHNSFASGMSKGQKIQLLIEYAQRREQQPELLRVLQQQRPEQYARRLASHGDPPGAEPPHPASLVNDPRTLYPKPAADSSRALRVFLCHSSADKPAVRELYQRLCADGIDAWLDEENLLPGQDWQREIPRAVRQSDAVIVCLSRGSINKAGYIQKEIKFALDVADEQPEDTIFLIPLKLEECEVPERLSRWQWVNHFDPNGYARLMKALRARAGSLEATTLSTQSSSSLQRSLASQSFAFSYIHDVNTTGNVQVSNRGGRIAPPSRSIANVQMWGGVEFVRIPAGKFLMGSKPDNLYAYDEEKPQHSVEISYDYWLARYPVTNEQFARFVEEAPYKFSQDENWKKKADHPVVNVSWQDAMEYCKWLNTPARADAKRPSPGFVVRLPGEAEWEKAARGEYGNEWPWGNEFDPTKCNSSEGKKGGTTPVGAYSPQGDSPYGVADMAGNVWEWTISLWGSDSGKPQYGYPYQFKDGREKLDAPDDVLRVVRGGSFGSDAGGVRSAIRGWYVPRYRLDYSQGFRVVVAPAFS